MPSARDPHPRKTADVGGRRMSYVEVGQGDPIVFLHGNPTSSYLWRNVIPHLQNHGRCIAPDLIGMGGSDKLPPRDPDRYRFTCHRRYLDELFDQLGVRENVTLVIHDWGSALGFDWARRHPGSVRAIAYMEAIVRPMSWDEWPEAARDMFRALRSPAGEAIILDKNVFVERILPASVVRELGEEEMQAYRAPFQTREDRWPTLVWPREIPLDGEPKDVAEIVGDTAAFLAASEIPKLFVNAEPGVILTGPQREFCRTFPNQTEVTVPGSHFLQEDAPDEIGQAVASWLSAL
ncbi:MAG: haloalkane dehalogenase [Myxococcota bacterium]